MPIAAELFVDADEVEALEVEAREVEAGEVAEGEVVELELLLSVEAHISPVHGSSYGHLQEAHSCCWSCLAAAWSAAVQLAVRHVRAAVWNAVLVQTHGRSELRKEAKRISHDDRAQ